jgi:hypothetical protein
MTLRSFVLALWLLVPALAFPQDGQYYAGTVVESTAEQLTVSRVLQGKNETRVFRITTDTKIEGRLAPNVRVTVGWITDDAGDRATLIIVRPEPMGKNKK